MTNIAAPTPAQKDQFWLDHLKRCRVRQQTLAEYARAADLKVSRLYAWKTCLQARGLWEDRESASFLPVQVVGTPAPSSGVRLQLPNGVALEFNSPLDAAFLTQLLQLARGLP